MPIIRLITRIIKSIKSHPRKLKMSRTESQKIDWFINAFLVSGVIGKQVAIVADLDETLLAELSRLEEAGNPEKFSQSIQQPLVISRNKHYFKADPNAFDQLKLFQERGHKIMVVTCAAYPFEYIQGLFQQFGIELIEENYHNRSNLESCGFSAYEKPEYIDSKSGTFTYDCMLFDNMEENEPGGDCLFSHVDIDNPFPNLEIEFYNALAKQLATFETHEDATRIYALKAPSDRTNTFSEILYRISRIHSQENLFKLAPLIARVTPLLNALNSFGPDFDEIWYSICKSKEWGVLLTACPIRKLMDIFSEAGWKIILRSENAPETLYQMLLKMAVNIAITLSRGETQIHQSFQQLQSTVHSSAAKYSREQIEWLIAKQRITGCGVFSFLSSNIGAKLDQETRQYLTIAAELETKFPTLPVMSRPEFLAARPKEDYDERVMLSVW